MKIKNLHNLEGPCQVCKSKFRHKGAHLKLERARARPEWDPSKIKWTKDDYFSVLGGGPFDQGVLPWLISPPSPELWLRH